MTSFCSLICPFSSRIGPFEDDVVGVVPEAAEDERALLAVEGELVQEHPALGLNGQALRQVDAAVGADANELDVGVITN